MIDEDTCTCDEVEPGDTHTCPYNEEVLDDYESECACCDYCFYMCEMEI